MAMCKDILMLSDLKKGLNTLHKFYFAICCRELGILKITVRLSALALAALLCLLAMKEEKDMEDHLILFTS